MKINKIFNANTDLTLSDLIPSFKDKYKKVKPVQEIPNFEIFLQDELNKNHNYYILKEQINDND